MPSILQTARAERAEAKQREASTRADKLTTDLLSVTQRIPTLESDLEAARSHAIDLAHQLEL